MKLKSRGCNVYLLRNSGETFLVDAGTDAELILKQVEWIDGILITHSHFDHVAASNELQKEFGCPVYVHELDIPYLLGEKRFSYRGALGIIARIGERIFRFKPPEDIRKTSELKSVSIGVIHTPGHTPGSVCFLKDGELYCGDLMRGNRLSARSFCWNYKAYLESVQKISDAEFTKILPGHGREISRAEYEKLLDRVKHETAHLSSRRR